MTRDEYAIFYFMTSSIFTKIKNPTTEQCLVWLRSYGKEFRSSQLNYIPEKHRKFCEAQIKIDLQLSKSPITTTLTVEQCITWLYNYPKHIRIKQLKRIPKKHREFCKTQLKLENLL